MEGSLGHWVDLRLPPSTSTVISACHRDVRESSTGFRYPKWVYSEIRPYSLQTTDWRETHGTPGATVDRTRSQCRAKIRPLSHGAPPGGAAYSSSGRVS